MFIMNTVASWPAYLQHVNMSLPATVFVYVLFFLERNHYYACDDNLTGLDCYGDLNFQLVVFDSGSIPKL